MKSAFWSAGHKPTLIAAFLYFDLAFMVWVILGPLAPEISKTLGLTPAEKGLMVAVPTLAGAILRLGQGLLVDRIGPKRTGTISQVIVILGLFAAWFFGVTRMRELWRWASSSACRRQLRRGLALASRWYPPGIREAMGVAGMATAGRCSPRCSANLGRAFRMEAVLGWPASRSPSSLSPICLWPRIRPTTGAKADPGLSGPLKTADACGSCCSTASFRRLRGLAASLSLYFTDTFGLTQSLQAI